jgi:hypothetical protein
VQIGALRQIIIGAGFIIVLQVRPRGLFPEPLRTYKRPAAGPAESRAAGDGVETIIDCRSLH